MMERINSAIFSDAVFAMERIEELQSKLEVKENPSALKHSSREEAHPFFTYLNRAFKR